MKSFFKNRDMFGKPLQLKLGKNIKKTTIFGGVISLLTYLIIFFSLVYKVIEFFERDQPTVNFKMKQKTYPSAMNLTKQNLNLVFALVDSKTYNLIEDIDSYFDFVFYFTKYTKTESTDVNKKKLVVNTRNCSELEHSSQAYEYLNRFNKRWINNSICMGDKLKDSNEDIIINGTFMENNFSQISIWIYKCNQTNRNLTNNEKKCKNDEEINIIRDKSYLELFFVDTNSKSENYSYPFDTYMANLYWKLSSSSSFKSNIKFKNIEIHTDVGFFSHVLNVISFFSFDHYEHLETQKSQSFIFNNIGVMYIFPSLNNHIYTRIYLRLEDIAASIGGFYKILMLIGNFITAFPFKFRLYQTMINNIWSFNYESSSKLNRIENIIVDDNLKNKKNFELTSFSNLNIKNNNIESSKILSNLEYYKSREISNPQFFKRKRILSKDSVYEINDEKSSNRLLNFNSLYKKNHKSNNESMRKVSNRLINNKFLSDLKSQSKVSSEYSSKIDTLKKIFHKKNEKENKFRISPKEIFQMKFRCLFNKPNKQIEEKIKKIMLVENYLDFFRIINILRDSVAMKKIILTDEQNNIDEWAYQIMK